jgi:sugar phosphate isomerase/epimerase
MQLAAVTNEVLPDVSPGALTRILRAAAQEGITTFEVRTLEGKRFPAMDPAAWEQLRSAAASFGIRYSAVSPGLFKAELGSDLIQAQADHLLPMSLDLAEKLDVKTLIVFAPMRTPGERPSDFARVADLLGDAADRAAARGFEVQLENLPGSWADTSDACLALLSEVSRRNFGYVWDTGNLYEAEGVTFEAGFEKLKPYIRNVHLKDGRIIDGRMVRQRFGTGETDVKGQVAVLKAHGYGGTLVLEAACHPHAQDDFASSLRYLRTII